MKILKLPAEQWKLIPDLPFLLDGEFEISNHGRVRRVSTGKIVKGGVRGDVEGWKRVFLTAFPKKKNIRQQKKYIARTSVTPHRMVWRLFGDEPATTSRHIYHINKCREDNYIWNLALTNKRFHKRRVARWKKEGKYYHKRGRRYYHDRKGS